MQQTLKSRITCAGIGLHSGKTVKMALKPAPVDNGIVFVRTDLPHGRAVVPARWDNVVDTRLCTVIGNEHGTTIGTIEHLMAALRGCNIDNVIVEVDAAELPIMDGSSEPFVFLIECAGVARQDKPRKAIQVLREVSVTEGDKTATLSPDNGASYSFEIDFDNRVVARQEQTIRLINGAFKSELSRARTFGFLHEVEMMREAGLALGGSLDNAIVIDHDKVLNKDGLRYTDEFVRHKILDSIGDLYLAGGQILGHFHGIRAGHAMNNKLLHALFADKTAFRMVDLPAITTATPQARMDIGLDSLPQAAE